MSDEIYQEGYEQGCADGEDHWRDTVATGFYLAAQDALQDYYSSVLTHTMPIIRHGYHSKIEGVLRAMEYTAHTDVLYSALTREWVRVAATILHEGD